MYWNIKTYKSDELINDFINEKIDEWHESSELSMSLSQYIKMSENEYNEFVMHNTIPENYLERWRNE